FFVISQLLFVSFFSSSIQISVRRNRKQTEDEANRRWSIGEFDEANRRF
ncbi:unnamed protein product, partial [Arabidopsis halleri]